MSAGGNGIAKGVGAAVGVVGVGGTPVGIAGGTVGTVVWRYERYCGMRPLCMIH